jgi:4-amino-4-deoxy-L-arabinose transferase-like glycosyltransferase
MTEPSPRAALVARSSVAVVVLAILALVLGRLSSFGIWDPWELTAADAARHRLAGDAVGTQTAPQLSTALVALGFRLFSVHEWSGRLPMAIAGLCALGVTFLLVERTVDRRAGVHAVIAAVTTPLFLLNARQMVGSAPALLASTLVFAGAYVAVFPPASASSDRVGVVGLLGGGFAGGVAVARCGALLGLDPRVLVVGA